MKRTPPGSAERQLGMGYKNVMMSGGDYNSIHEDRPGETKKIFPALVDVPPAASRHGYHHANVPENCIVDKFTKSRVILK
jgi:hypothetical protein